MGNILVKAPKLKIIRPEVADVYFAKKIEQKGSIVFEKIESGRLETEMYIILETKHIKEGFMLKINLFQYMEKRGQVHIKNTKEEDLVIKVGNYKDKGGTSTQAIAKVMLGFSTKNDLFYYPLEKENKLYVTLSVDADGNGEADKTVCFNLKEYKYNYVDDPNFWYRKNRFELEEKKCFCSRDFTVEELKGIVKKLREGEEYVKGMTMYERTGIRLFSLANQEGVKYDEKLNDEECNFEKFTYELNKALNDFEINTCIRKIHFLAQCYHESSRFRATYESNPPSHISGGKFYRGRGIIQITNDFTYLKFKNHLKDNSPLESFVPKVAKEMRLACQAAGYYWKYVGAKYGNINQFADKDDVTNVSKEVFGYSDKINGLESRKKYTELLKEIMDYENCRNKK